MFFYLLILKLDINFNLLFNFHELCWCYLIFSNKAECLFILALCYVSLKYKLIAKLKQYMMSAFNNYSRNISEEIMLMNEVKDVRIIINPNSTFTFYF